MTRVGTDQWKRLETYRQRYQIEDRLDPVHRLERSIDRRKIRLPALRRRLDDLDRQLGEVLAEIDAIETEIARSRAAGAILISEIVDQVRIDTGEAWSPRPVRGFRVWRIEGDEVKGNQVVWPTPSLTAKCLRERPGDDIPHAGWACGPPACGIYAVKELGMFPEEVAGGQMPRSIVGVVALSGKVVEHRDGYRGQSGTAVGVSVNYDGSWILTAEAGLIEAIFDDPVTAARRFGTSATPDPIRSREFLEKVKAREEQWI